MWQQSAFDCADEDNVLADGNTVTWRQAEALCDLMEWSHYVNLDCSLQDRYVRKKDTFL